MAIPYSRLVPGVIVLLGLTKPNKAGISILVVEYDSLLFFSQHSAMALRDSVMGLARMAMGWLSNCGRVQQ